MRVVLCRRVLGIGWHWLGRVVPWKRCVRCLADHAVASVRLRWPLLVALKIRMW